MAKLNLNNEKILELYNSGLSSIKIAQLFNCGDSTIRKRLHDMNVQLRDNAQYRKKHTWDDNFFHTIDTEEKAYWLGFMYADGNVRECHHSYYIKLAVADKEVLEKFKKSLQASHSIGQYHRKIPGKDLYYLIISSKQMATDLISHGCIPRKSLVLKFPTTVPKHLIWHFIRGYFDGDGCVCTYDKVSTQTYKEKTTSYKYTRTTFNICGTKEFLEELNKYCPKARLYKEKRRKSNCYKLESQNQQTVLKFLQSMYKGASIYLERKYQKYKEFQKKTFNDYNTAPTQN